MATTHVKVKANALTVPMLGGSHENFVKGSLVDLDEVSEQFKSRVQAGDERLLELCELVDGKRDAAKAAKVKEKAEADAKAKEATKRSADEAHAAAKQKAEELAAKKAAEAKEQAPDEGISEAGA